MRRRGRRWRCGAGLLAGGETLRERKVWWGTDRATSYL
jgi:hypothetical protein